MSPSRPEAAGVDEPAVGLSEALRRASAVLAAAGVPSPRADAELLAAHLLSRQEGTELGRGDVMARALAGTGTAPEGFDALVEERARRVPLQHLTGTAWFRHLTLSVGPGVFVPRPETELLVDHLNEFLARPAAERPGEDSPLVVDLATGSGAIALAAAQENPSARVVGVELSEAALAWARRNAERLREEQGVLVQLRHEDAARALPGLEGLATVVVSNPPYVPEDAVPVDPEVAEHDPPTALYGGSADGLRIPQAFLERAVELLAPGGLLVMEHAEVQGPELARRFRAAGLQEVRTLQDLTGRDRATRGILPHDAGSRAAGPGAERSAGASEDPAPHTD